MGGAANAEGLRGLTLACGALGRFDRSVVHRITAALSEDLGEVYRDERSVLFLDRPALRWESGASAGVGWAESANPVDTARVSGWLDASREGMLGLAGEGRDHVLHSSISGAAPLYWGEHNGAVYFSTRLDALVRALPGQLAPDWSAWASILTLGYALAALTPFAGIHRLEPCSRVIAGESGTRTEVASWPWAQVEASLSAAEGVGAVTELLREQIGSYPSGPCVCPLTGGWDSRMLLCLLRERGEPVTAWTINSDTGDDSEEALSQPVAAELGVEHVIVPPSPEQAFLAEARESMHATEWQSSWKLRMLRLSAAIGPRRDLHFDGLAGDWLKTSFTTAETLHQPGSRANLPWDRFAAVDLRHPILRKPVAAALASEARTVFDRVVEPYHGHPAAGSLALIRVRTPREIGPAPTELHAAARPLALPFLADRITTAALSVRFEDKLDFGLYSKVFDLVAPAVGRLPTVKRPDPARPPSPRARSRRSEAANAAYLTLLDSHPLRPWFSRGLRRAIRSGEMTPFLRSPRHARTLEALCAFGEWHRRYDSRLGELDLPTLERQA